MTLFSILKEYDAQVFAIAEMQLFLSKDLDSFKDDHNDLICSAYKLNKCIRFTLNIRIGTIY